MAKSIPFYDLYGDAFIRSEPELVHVENIAHRSSGLQWEIAPHRHTKLAQMVMVFDNDWQVMLDDKVHRLSGNWLTLIPAGIVHGFQFQPYSQGFVISINNELFSAIDGIDDVNWQPQAIEFKSEVHLRHLRHQIELLMYELNYNEIGQGQAVSQLIRLILINVLRQQKRQDLQASPSNKESQVIINFRALIEADYKQHANVAQYAKKLHVSVSKLNRLCQRFFADSPKAIIHKRLIIEAKRRLLYTSQTVEDIAEQLGFADSGYFCRFFKQTTGVTANTFRKNADNLPLLK
ncbi:helix-turn-helix domain-containing protein [Shewanella sp. UCD-KL21]|uniref:helix-turn-helix domain-containing protein n=1 Tax=Shewanella sp. UCD-KL21 TaxID=1917164 RepID=UPI0009702A53|nr:helix-turn-helix domain-containing protein [Shewanella sp. UCD-KL21]